MTTGTSIEFRRYALHIMVDEFQIGVVGFDLQVKRAGGLYGIDIAVDMASGNVFFADTGI